MKPNVFTRGRGKNAPVKLMKTSQNTALLWLIQPSRQVPNPEASPGGVLSSEGLVCVRCWKRQACATHFLSAVLKIVRPVLFITRKLKNDLQKRLTSFLQPVRLTLKHMSSKLTNTSCRSSDLGKGSSIITRGTLQRMDSLPPLLCPC